VNGRDRDGRSARLLADHATCEQQAAINALGLIGTYGDDAGLVEKLGALAQRRSSIPQGGVDPQVARPAGRGIPPQPYATRCVNGCAAAANRRNTSTGCWSVRSSRRAARAVHAPRGIIAGRGGEGDGRGILPAEERHFELFLELAARVRMRIRCARAGMNYRRRKGKSTARWGASEIHG